MMVCALAREGFYQTCDEGPPLPTHAVSGGALVLLHRALRDALPPTMSHSRSWSEIRTGGTCGHFFQKPTSKRRPPPLQKPFRRHVGLTPLTPRRLPVIMKPSQRAGGLRILSWGSRRLMPFCARPTSLCL